MRLAIADGFPAGGRAIVHRGIGNIGAEQARDLRLEFKQHLQRALRDFRLIGRIGGQELAALDQVIDRSGNVVAVCPCPQKERRRPRRNILRRQRRHVALNRHFAGVLRQAGHGPGQACGGGHIHEQGIERGSRR